MNCAPAKEDMTVQSLNSLRSWTCGANSEPYAAEAMKHAYLIVAAVVTVVVVVITKVAAELVGTNDVSTEVIVTVGEKTVAVL